MRGVSYNIMSARLDRESEDKLRAGSVREASGLEKGRERRGGVSGVSCKSESLGKVSIHTTVVKKNQESGTSSFGQEPGSSI